MTTLIGTRVRLIEVVDNYPTCLIDAGETGTLVNIDREGSYWIELDDHHPELNEWNNQVQIWDYSEFGEGRFHPESYFIEMLDLDRKYGNRA